MAVQRHRFNHAVTVILVPILLALTTGCKPAEETSTKTPSNQALSKQHAPSHSASMERFCLMALQLECSSDANPQLDELTGAQFRTRVIDHLVGLDLISAPNGEGQPATKPTCQARSSTLQQVGIGLRFDYLLERRGQEDQRPAAATGDGHLRFAVQAHAERRGPSGGTEVGQSVINGAVPRAERVAEFITVRLLRASNLAVTDALGQLWVRHMSDQQVLSLLDDPSAWKKSAAARECGERKLHGSIKQLHEAARSSRTDLAVVAIAALGRMADQSSVTVLRARLQDHRLEVIDAALVALSDIGGKGTIEAIEATASGHSNRRIRQRARTLLER